MSRTVLVSTSPDLERQAAAATSGELAVLPLWPLPAEPWDLLAHIRSAELPDVMILDPGVATEQALGLAARFSEQYPTVNIVIVSDLGAEIGLDAMRAGVRDILHPGSDASEIRLVLERIAQAAAARVPMFPMVQPAASASPTRPEGRRGTIISVTSPKGGVGKTTVATNLAVGLAQTAPNSTVIVDLDVQFGDVASALNLSPSYTLPDVLHAPIMQDSMALKSFLTLHATGLYAICGAASPAAADSVTSDSVSELLQALAADFRWVVVDTAPGISPITLSALDHSNELVLVASMDVPAVRGLRKEMDTLRDLNMFEDHRHIVLNFTDSSGGLTVGDVEQAIGAKIDVTLPRSKAVPASINQGIPLLQSQTRDPMTKQLRTLVERFVGPSETPNRWRSRARHRRADESEARQ